MSKLPTIALIPGDPAGIGPELIAKLVNNPDTLAKARILLIGDQWVFEQGQQQAKAPFSLSAIDPTLDKHHWQTDDSIAWYPMQTVAQAQINNATVSRSAGNSSLQTLNQALDFAVAGHVDAITFAPFNKSSLHLANLGHDDELHYMAEYLAVDNYISELNTLDGIWTSRVTSHIPLSQVAQTIASSEGTQRIEAAIELANQTLKRAGVSRPRIAVAALNPHAGDNGNFGHEEIDIIAPAIARMAKKQIKVDGPWPSDTVFLKAQAKEIDAVVTMYHDQGQIALKLMGFDRGVTVQGGLPMPITTPAHGTAFDIVGTGTANVGAIQAAFNLACDMASSWSTAASVPSSTAAC